MKKEFTYKFDDLYAPVIEALKALGGSGTVSEIEDKIAASLKLTDDELSDIHRGNRTKFSYRLAWARNYLKRFGLLENLTRGVWALTPKAQALGKLSKKEVNKHVRALYEKEEKKVTVVDGDIEEGQDRPWQEDLLELVKELRPEQFERLCQRLLRLLGFIEVEVTGKSGDGGIDGKGILRLGGVMSFHVVFQAKRYAGSVSSPTIRDFRGAMMGRADKGLIITTGNFTKDARAEASRDGATPIDLIDGYDFVEKLKEVRLGIDIEMVERVHLKPDWFRSL